jgi:diamine N-acetyltransferase
MPINFRSASEADVAQLMGFMQDYYEFDHHPFQATLAQRALEQLLHHPDWGQVWLIEQQTVSQPPRSIGYAVLTFGYSLEYLGRDAFVDEIYLQDAYRGQGIGQQAFQFLKTTCQALGIKALHLEVERSNQKAHGFYQKIGFRQKARYLMTKQL